MNAFLFSYALQAIKPFPRPPPAPRPTPRAVRAQYTAMSELSGQVPTLEPYESAAAMGGALDEMVKAMVLSNLNSPATKLVQEAVASQAAAASDDFVLPVVVKPQDPGQHSDAGNTGAADPEITRRNQRIAALAGRYTGAG